MSEPQREKPQAVTERAEEALEQIGQRIGLLTSRVRQRMREAVASVESEADRMDQPGAVSTKEAGQERAAQPAMERAEEVVGRWERQLGMWASLAGLQVQKTVARVREDAEDMWVEAQNIRKQGRH